MATEIQCGVKLSAALQTIFAASSNPQVRQYAGTFAAEFAVLACQIVVYKLAAQFLGTVGFGEYAVARRTISLLQPVVLLGIGVGLPRYVAMAEANGDFHRVRGFFGSAVWCIGLAVGIAGTALIVWRDWFSYLFFGSRTYANLPPAVAVALVGLSIHAICYSLLRGRLVISRANWLNLLNLGLLPVCVLISFHTSTAAVLWGLAIGWTFVSLFALAWTPLTAVFQAHRQEQRELLTYGVQRVPGDFMLMALLAIPAIFAAHTSDIRMAGYVAFGVSITSMIASMFSPVGVILLPKVSANLKNGLIVTMRREIRLIGLLAVLIPLVLIAVVEVLAPLLIRVYLGGEFESAVHVVRIIATAALPLSVYYALRSVLDGFHHRAVNTINLFRSILAFAALSSLVYFSQIRIDLMLWSFVFAATLLAGLTILEVAKILRRGNSPIWKPKLAPSEGLDI